MDGCGGQGKRRDSSMGGNENLCGVRNRKGKGEKRVMIHVGYNSGKRGQKK